MGNKSVDLNQSNWLAALRDNLRDTHAAVKAAIKDSLRHAMAAGDILVEAKGGLKHGEWLPWLRSAGSPSARPSGTCALPASAGLLKPNTTRCRIWMSPARSDLSLTANGKQSR